MIWLKSSNFLHWKYNTQKKTKKKYVYTYIEELINFVKQ